MIVVNSPQLNYENIKQAQTKSIIMLLNSTADLNYAQKYKIFFGHHTNFISSHVQRVVHTCMQGL